MCGNGLESGGINAHSGKEYIPLLTTQLIKLKFGTQLKTKTLLKFWSLTFL